MTTAFRIDAELRKYGPSGWIFISAHRVDGRSVRVRLRIDRHTHQGFAVVDVLTNELTWTTLIDAEPLAWVPAVSKDELAGAADTYAERLVQRALTILRSGGSHKADT